jgi:hypothetical protein
VKCSRDSADFGRHLQRETRNDRRTFAACYGDGNVESGIGLVGRIVGDEQAPHEYRYL